LAPVAAPVPRPVALEVAACDPCTALEPVA
jgi:hypothetical protein